MEEKDKIKYLLNKLEDEALELMYEKPKCDFEHIWNSAIDTCCDVINSWKEPEDLELNMDKFKPTVDFGGNTEVAKSEVGIVDNLNNERVATLTKNKIKHEVHKDYGNNKKIL